jgi:hypothetical protein
MEDGVDEFERTKEEAIVDYFSIYLEGLRKTTKNLSRDSGKSRPTRKWDPHALSLQQTCGIIRCRQRVLRVRGQLQRHVDIALYCDL